MASLRHPSPSYYPLRLRLTVRPNGDDPIEVIVPGLAIHTDCQDEARDFARLLVAAFSRAFRSVRCRVQVYTPASTARVPFPSTN